MIRAWLIALHFTWPLLMSAQSPIDPSNYNPDTLAQAIFEATNALRLKKGLEALKPSSSLSNASEYQANRMASEKSLQHHWPNDPVYGTPRQRIEKFKGNFQTTGENIAQDYLLSIPSGKSYFLGPKREALSRSGQKIPFRSYEELAKKVVEDWYRSKGHRQNLLGNYKYLGIGASFLVPEKKGPNFDVYLVQNFGT